MSPQDSRGKKLTTYLHSVLGGKRRINSGGDAKKFLESICQQEDRSHCVEKLLASPYALEALKIAVRIDISAAFINTSIADFINYLSDPVIKQLCSSQFLQRLLFIMADPPTLVAKLVNLLASGELCESAVQAFAWMLHELLIMTASRDQVEGFVDIAQALTDMKFFTSHKTHDVRILGHKIEKMLLLRGDNLSKIGEVSAGGRHDNDFADFRKISILPTGDELLSRERAFYRRADAILDVEPFERPALHLDNQFRLLREDMLADLRLDFQVAMGQKQAKRAVVRLEGLCFAGVYLGEPQRRKPSSLKFHCQGGLPRLPPLKTPTQRKTFLEEHKNYLKHQSFGCLVADKTVLAFASLERDVAMLAADVPIVVLTITNPKSLETVMVASLTSTNLQYVAVDTPIFAYAPVLRCLQSKVDFPLASQLLCFQDTRQIPGSELEIGSVTDRIAANHGRHLDRFMNLPKEVNLDKAQTQSLVAGLQQSVSLIQGPPGTGKSFIGALLAKYFHDYTKETVLVLSYTNHALDQYLEDLIDIGIPETSMVRLGSKNSLRTAPLSLSKQKHVKLSSQEWAIFQQHNDALEALDEEIKKKVSQMGHSRVSYTDILEYLEFTDEYEHFFEALSLPESHDGMQVVGWKGKAIADYYLLERWRYGHDPGALRNAVECSHRPVWMLPPMERAALYDQWLSAVVKEKTSSLAPMMQTFDRKYNEAQRVLKMRTDTVLRQKRIIGCTTTGAAMFSSELQSANAGVVIVEEAGEILESHVLTAMTEQTKQLILIGDHKQLRPKISNFELTVEKGHGYNLDQSLFERLVLAGFPHQALSTQHRMAPEISAIVKHLTYPELQDAKSTQGRPGLRGLQDRVIFWNHEQPEQLEENVIADRRDQGATTSKRNAFEAEMVLRCVRYLAQQGYGTDKLVVLTPYVGQLSLLRQSLSKENDPILNDLDSHDLVRAGLMTPAGAAQTKRPIRLSSIDNYQGEESDIVVISLTRSNAEGAIGFMRMPQRLNVLLSRARIGMILIGNSSTFTKSEKGHETWTPFLQFLKEHGHLYDGLPVKCERHPDRTNLLRQRADFEEKCPDGGCSEPCGTVLECGKHSCPQRCHQLVDHSKMECQQVLKEACLKGHQITYKCSQRKTRSCFTCQQEAALQKQREERDHRLDQERRCKQAMHAQRLAEIQDEIAHENRILRERREDGDRRNAVKQLESDLERLRAQRKLAAQQAASASASAKKCERPSESEKRRDSALGPEQPPDVAMSGVNAEMHKMQFTTSDAKDDWEWRKSTLGERNEFLDELMGMIGLENVKEQFLSIKDKIDLAVRQNIDLKHERLSASLLGNPGTGKTTVARLYAKFLTSVGALPGSFFKETTGSNLANDGVSGCKKIIEDILNNNGGALFIDEAYQLASGHHYGGKQVLDYLLAEVENLRGKVVFILAGYNKQMEAFFAHNPGLPSRFPHEMQFQDYEDDELLRILNFQVDKRYGGRLTFERGINGLYARIVARRIGRGRGREGFGNARAVENAFSQITARQAKRIRRERKAGGKPDDMLLTREDLIGAEPSGVLSQNKSWRKLQNMIGLGAVKESLQALFGSIEYNYQRELEDKPLIEFNLNRVFVGSPGTGKTTVAKLYGQILADLGLLSNGEVVVKTPADFVGSALGESEKNTKGILAATKGKVLVIDEAYGLCGNLGGSGSGSDPYKTAVIDTIVAEVHSTPGDDRCVLLLGYFEQMQEMFQSVNPGLSRRFPLDSAFLFEDFDDRQMRQILDMKIQQQAIEVLAEAKNVAMEVLKRARNRPNFGNAGEVDIILNDAKVRQQKRLATTSQSATRDFTLHTEDFDPDYDRGSRAATNIRKLFADVVGGEALINKLEEYQRTVANMKARNMDPREQIPFNFLFRGPPGTGKTTTARKMGKVYYDMGFLTTAEVVDCSATELVGEYVGQTGPKTQRLLNKALGKVLFIDEAYRLADGAFAKEAMDELVDSLTKPKFASRMITILAGYDQDINTLMAMNPGLTSRFPETITFDSLDPAACVALLTNLLQKRKPDLDCSVLEHPSKSLQQQILGLFAALAQVPNWANARDVQTIAKGIFQKVISTADTDSACLRLEEEQVTCQINNMLSERRHRSESVKHNQLALHTDQLPQMEKPPSFSSQLTTTKTTTKTAETSLPQESSTQEATSMETRDAGVDEQTWQQLQHDKAISDEQEKAREELLRRESEAREALAESARQAKAALAREEATLKALEMQNRRAEADEARRRFEQERIAHELRRRAQEAELAELERQRKEAEEERKREAKAQQKLRTMGVCCAGFRWIKQAEGYRCAGGSHYVSNAQLF